MDESGLEFYELLASNYHRIYDDWRKEVVQQGIVLRRFISRYNPNPSLTILDCSCGIGTQAIGLALQRYTVHATDINTAPIERAEQEAHQMGAMLTFGVADMRLLRSQVAGMYDVVLSCDNALPHLLTGEDLHLALKQIRAMLYPQGLFLASMRDYDRFLIEKPHATVPRLFDTPGDRRIVFQLWDWIEEEQTHLAQLFILTQMRGEWQTQEFTTRYRILQRKELSEALAYAGFSQVEWYMPPDSGFYHPLVIARKET